MKRGHRLTWAAVVGLTALSASPGKANQPFPFQGTPPGVQSLGGREPTEVMHNHDWQQVSDGVGRVMIPLFAATALTRIWLTFRRARRGRMARPVGRPPTAV